MKIVTTSAGGIFGALMFGAWHVIQLLGPDNHAISSEKGGASAPKVGAAIGEHRPVESHGDRNVSDGSRDYTALENKVELLKRAQSFLGKRRSYSANLSKREVVHGELLEEQMIHMKVDMNPFRVYLRWDSGDTGREVIYIEGANHGKMIAHDGGWKARIPAFYLEPTCSLAMRDARYPVTSAGLLFLIDTMLDVHQEDLAARRTLTCECHPDAEFDGRPAISFVTVYGSQDESPQYRKSVTVFDRDSSIPVSTAHYEWPSRNSGQSGLDLDEATLIERYCFHNLEFDPVLTDVDFDRRNPEYKFR